MLALDRLPRLFQNSKQTKSFQMMVVSMRRAFREYLSLNLEVENKTHSQNPSTHQLQRETLFSLGESLKFLTVRISKTLAKLF